MSCPTPFCGAHRCRVGGGHAYYSDDGERTWFCREHSPAKFSGSPSNEAAKMNMAPDDELIVL